MTVQPPPPAPHQPQEGALAAGRGTGGLGAQLGPALELRLSDFSGLSDLSDAEHTGSSPTAAPAEGESPKSSSGRRGSAARRGGSAATSSSAAWGGGQAMVDGAAHSEPRLLHAPDEDEQVAAIQAVAESPERRNGCDEDARALSRHALAAESSHRHGGSAPREDTQALLGGSRRSSGDPPDARVPGPWRHPIPRARRFYMVAVFCLTAALLHADQNLMAPNLTAIARDFGFDDAQRDWYLGGVTSACFFLVGAPAALAVGYLSGHVNRKNLLFVVVLLGEGPCLATYWVTRYWQLLVLRLLTGISIGGTFPLVFSLMGDLFPAHHRSAVAAGVQIAVGVGMSIGQFVAAYLGTAANWRWPFVAVAVPAIAAATLMVLTAQEPPRGVAEAALSAQYAAAEGFEYDEKLDWAKLRQLLRVRTNLAMMLQGLPGSLPWGVFLTFFNDFLSQQKGLSIPDATWVVSVWGLGGGAGVVLGGGIGQALYNWRPAAMPVFVGACVGLGALPMWWLANASLATTPLAAAVAAAFVGGALVSPAGPNIRAALLNVNEPEARGMALALQIVLDDVGRGAGPALVAALISGLGRQAAFNVAIGGWVPCGFMLAAAAPFIGRDAATMQERLRAKVALAPLPEVDAEEAAPVLMTELTPARPARASASPLLPMRSNGYAAL